MLAKIKRSSINRKSYAMLCTGATFVKKNSCLVARIHPYYTGVLYLLAFYILEPYPSIDIALGLSHITSR